jgi:hypothetical protein
MPDLKSHENESTDLLLSSSFAAILNSSSWTIWLTFNWLMASSEMSPGADTHAGREEVLHLLACSAAIESVYHGHDCWARPIGHVD